MKVTTMREAIEAMLGVPVRAIPLSVCRIKKAYLLERSGISRDGTVLLFAIPYLMTEDALAPYRNVSLYAVPRDYHGYMKQLEDSILPNLCSAYPSHHFALFSDHSPIDEVDAAARAGLGVLGMSGLLLTEAYGSFVFLGEVVTDADYSTVTGHECPSFPATPPTCEACGACMAACPGGCTEADRGGCLSALTQKKGDLTEEEIRSVRSGGLLWGCDVCQLACPHNRAVIECRRDTPIPYFRTERLVHLDGALLEGMTDEQFRTRAYSWRGKRVVERNMALFATKDHLPNEDSERSST